MALRWERSPKNKTPSQNVELILTPNYDVDKKKVFTELKADFTLNWLTQSISLRKNDVYVKSLGRGEQSNAFKYCTYVSCMKF